MVMIFPINFFTNRLLPLLATFLILALGAAPSVNAASGGQKSFTSPEKGAKSLLNAVKRDDIKKLVAILGPGSEPLITSGDEVADRSGRKEFVKRYEENNRIHPLDPTKSILIIGRQEHPFPIPLVKVGKRWRFDTKEGKEEILNRRIGKNELNAIEVARAYLVAQREYACKDRDGDGAVAFAQRFRSHPGRRDGLFWEVKEGEGESPFGPLTAQAADEGYAENPRHAPYRGYLFKILKGQGENAVGGTYSYLVNGKMILGFALVAYPAQYGASGIMTFIVNQSGVVYQKDLGESTGSVAPAMTSYDPDSSWRKTE